MILEELTGKEMERLGVETRSWGGSGEINRQDAKNAK